MTGKQSQAYLVKRGFRLFKAGSKHMLFTDGISIITLSRTGPSSDRNVRNMIAEVNRAMKKRPPEVAKPKEEKAVDINRFNAKRVEATLAPGITRPMTNGHDKEEETMTEKRKKRPKYDGVIRRKLENRIVELWNQGKTDLGDLTLQLIRDGWKSPDGAQQIQRNKVQYYTSQLLASGTIKEQVVTKAEATTHAVTRKSNTRIPDTLMGILTDPDLSAEQKVRMCLAYAEI